MNRNLILLAMSLFAWGVGEGSFLYFQPLYLQELGADPIRIGAVMGGYGAAMAAAHIPAGLLADRIGRRQLIWAGWFLGILATSLMALADSLPLFIAGMITYGLTLFVLSPMNSYITAVRGRWSVGRAIMLVSASFNLGMVLGPLLGGMIGEHLGLRYIFRYAALIFVVATIIILFIQPQPVEKPSPSEKRNGFLWDPRYRTYMVAVFIASFGTYLAQPLSQNFLSNERGLSLEAIGGLLSLTGLGVVTLSIALGYIHERTGFLIAQAAVGIFAFLLWQGSSMPWYAFAYFLLGGFKTTRNLAVAQTQSLVHQADLGLAYGVTETVGSLATILAPLLAGYLYARSPTSVYAFSAGIILFSILAGAFLSPAPSTPIEPPSRVQEERI